MSDYQNEEKIEVQQQAIQRQKTAVPGGCSNCGHINPSEAKFCEECGAPLGGITCPACSAAVPSDGDICEACGAWLLEGKCSFCQAELPAEGGFCGECGNPSGGIPCPSCSTISFFDYCPNCHTKLTEQADEMVELLKENPQMQEFFSQKQEFAANLQEIKKLEEELAAPPKEKPPSFDQGNAAIIAAMAKSRRSQRPQRCKPAPPKPAAPVQHAQNEQPNSGDDFQKVLEERKKKLQMLKEKQENLKKSLAAPPPVDNIVLSSNQQIRRFQMAIKPPITKGWLCNAFQAIHQDPMHCTRPGDGGHWVTE